MEESDANNDPYSFDGYDSDMDKEYLPLDLEERYKNQIHFHVFGDTQEGTVEESVCRHAEVNLNERVNTKKGNSDYCRARTQGEYMESTLNVKKMYELYVNNLYQCDVCELNKLCAEEDRLTGEDKGHYQKHILEKDAARKEQ
ncbi:hypothetical protein ILUMI_06298 [Ignelater luminosus]|uniref:Uncharacterized protein n=1 Tax=Ignelater luminosus TaxID=2038154 RepID=A0A8K0CS10_IGNLU|nr:hypothetical protein ILUMI_16595 [Ignelater luminosus]KAF2899888.1 hypothetical protein ILUMI_06298 [Ignelater luminosus]